RSQSALFIFKDGFSKEQFILNNDNDHTLNLKVNGNKFVEASQQNAGMDSSYVILIVMSLLGFSFLIQKIILTNDEV
ncbi:MAG: hypothetical protein WBC58_12660, partial [Maribacter stanieri]